MHTFPFNLEIMYCCKDFLPLATIRAYFTRRAKERHSGEIVGRDEGHGNSKERLALTNLHLTTMDVMMRSPAIKELTK